MHPVAIVIPTLNGGKEFELLLASLKTQTYHPVQKLVIDSSSEDQTVELAREYGFAIVSIKRNEFNHGATRQLAVETLTGADFLIFLTQDAILAKPDSLKQLIESFGDPKVGAVYGRQLPRQGATLIEAYARCYNYPATSMVKTLADAPRLGIKTAFISNSFAGYRKTALQAAGGFPPDTVFGEDTFAAAKMLSQGWKIYYKSEAEVYHSHNYSYKQEFCRYFDIGVFHAREAWIRNELGQVEGEGIKYVTGEFKFLLRHNCFMIPSAFMRNVLKFCAYKLGLTDRPLPIWLKTWLSTNPKSPKQIRG
jgi:rhamnosyltransferase